LPKTTNIVGKRIRSLRLQRGFSIRQLAERCGLSHPFLSATEKGKTSPSVSSLKKILDVLGISLSEFFQEPPDVGSVAFYKANELTELADGEQLSYRRVGANFNGAQMLVLHERYAPGATTGSEPYNHEAQEGGIVIQGELTIHVDNITKVLGPGDAYYFDSRLPHCMENRGEEECIVVSAVTPPTF
jgi:transcriptional regulator with XRE-family HTH domain